MFAATTYVDNVHTTPKVLDIIVDLTCKPNVIV